jgi:hypothetical protein
MIINAVEKVFSDEGTKKAGRDIQPLPAFVFDNKLRRCFDPYLNHSVELRDIQ